MKAILCTRFGGPDDLELKEVPDPAAGPGEVVVAVKAAALNFFDTLIIAGKYQHKPPFPFSPAAEFAGVVESVGPDVTALARGDRVLGNIGAGAARERVVAKPERLIKLPDGLDFDHAAGLTVTYGTTLHALKDRAQLKPGETLAVLGAAGGTGLATIELGKLMGARVIACASSAEKLGRQGRRRRLRSGRRALCGTGGSRAGLGRAVPGHRFRGRRDPENPDQSRAAPQLGDRRRVLGRLGRTQSAGPPRQYDRHRPLVRRGQALRAYPCGLSAGEDRGSHQGAVRPQVDGQAAAAAVRRGLKRVRCLPRIMTRPAGANQLHASRLAVFALPRLPRRVANVKYLHCVC